MPPAPVAAPVAAVIYRLPYPAMRRGAIYIAPPLPLCIREISSAHAIFINRVASLGIASLVSSGILVRDCEVKARRQLPLQLSYIGFHPQQCDEVLSTLSHHCIGL
jgi:hypothetical protein